MNSIINGTISLDERDPTKTFQDIYFSNEIKRCVKIADIAYDEMRMRDALQTAFYDMQSVRDYYRDSCNKNGITMSKKLIYEWMECQLIIMEPIIPHFCEYAWKYVIKKTEQMKWPELGDYDISLYRSGVYLKKIMKQFRDTANKPNKKKNIPKPNKLYIYVAKEYPQWQQIILKFLDSKWENNGLPSDIIKTVQVKINETKELKSMGKQPMQYAAFVIKNDVPSTGRDALNLETPFDEYQVISENINYIQKDCGLDEVKVYHSTDESAPDPAKKKNGAIPAKPVAYFFNE